MKTHQIIVAFILMIPSLMAGEQIDSPLSSSAPACAAAAIVALPSKRVDKLVEGNEDQLLIPSPMPTKPFLEVPILSLNHPIFKECLVRRCLPSEISQNNVHGTLSSCNALVTRPYEYVTFTERGFMYWLVCNLWSGFHTNASLGNVCTAFDILKDRGITSVTGRFQFFKFKEINEFTDDKEGRCIYRIFEPEGLYIYVELHAQRIR